MMKTTNWMLMSLLMVGIGMNFASCKDDELTDEEKQQQAEQAAEETLGWWDVVSQLTDVQELPADWQKATFEPAVGKALESDPYTRVVSTNDLSTAAQRFAYLTGAPVDETTADYTWSHKDAGSLTYHAGSSAGTYMAQVDVNLKQMPKLKKILYQTPDQMGENASGSFSGTAYYRFGDVVRKQNADGYWEYWICVRPAFSLEGKGDSHWVSISNPPSANIYTKTKDGTTWYLPTKLGESKEHMQNFAEMLYAIINPDQYFANLADLKLKTFHDFGRDRFNKYHNKHFWKRVNYAWQHENLFTQLFGMPMDYVESTVNAEGLSLLYKGYSWMWGMVCSFWQANYSGINLKTATYTTPKLDMTNIQFNAKNFNLLNSSGDLSEKLFGNDYPLYIVRYATGATLCKDANGKSGGAYDVKQKLSNCEDVYVYNRFFYPGNDGKGSYDLGLPPEETPAQVTTHGFFAPGTVVRDKGGNLWICYSSWMDNPTLETHSSDHKTRFISFSENAVGHSFHEPIPSSRKEGIFARTLVPADEVVKLGIALRAAAFPATHADRTFAKSLEKNLRINPADLVVHRDSDVTNAAGTATASIVALNLAYGYRDLTILSNSGRQPYCRYITDGTRVASNRNDGQASYRYHYFYSRYVTGMDAVAPLYNVRLDVTHSFSKDRTDYDGHIVSPFFVPYDRWSHCRRHDTQIRDGNFTTANLYDRPAVTYDWVDYSLNVDGGAAARNLNTYFEPVIFVAYMEIDDDNFDFFMRKYNGISLTLVDDPMTAADKDQNIQFWRDYQDAVLPYLFGNERPIGGNPDLNVWDY